MKIKNISLTNFSKYDQVSVSFDDNVTYLIGKNGAGKSTLGITAIWFMFQGIAEKSSQGNNPLIGERFRFIGPKAATAKGEMILHDEKKGVDIKVMRKLTKSGTEVSFEAPEGYNLNQQWLTDLFNIFLIAPKKFTELTPKEQAKALGIDTKKFDEDIATLKTEYTSLNAVYRAFGDLQEVEKVEKVDLDDLQLQKGAIRNKLNIQYLENKKANEATRKAWQVKVDQIKTDHTLVVDKERTSIEAHNKTQNDRRDTILFLEKYRDRICDIADEVEGLRNLIDLSKLDAHINNLPKPEELKQFVTPEMPYLPAEPEYVQELPDDKELQEIEQKITEAGETNLRALAYTQYLEKKAKKEAKEVELKDNKDKQAQKEKERIDYIKGFKFPFSNISVGEDGELLLNGKPIKEPYFSTGEILKVVPILLATTNPELKYVFIQGFNDLDDDNQKVVEEHLTGKGFQLVVELVGKEKVESKNCILLRDNIVVDDYSEEKREALEA